MDIVADLNDHFAYLTTEAQSGQANLIEFELNGKKQRLAEAWLAADFLAGLEVNGVTVVVPMRQVVQIRCLPRGSSPRVSSATLEEFLAGVKLPMRISWLSNDSWQSGWLLSAGSALPRVASKHGAIWLNLSAVEALRLQPVENPNRR